MKKSPKERIEESLEPGKERVYIKTPGEPLIDITRESSRYVSHDNDLKREIIEMQNASGKYNMLHNHPTRAIEIEKAFPIMMPSRDDWETFLTDDSRTMTIAQQNENNKINGYLFVRKTKNTPLTSRKEVYKNVLEYLEKIGLGKSKNKTEKIKKRLGYLTYKYLPVLMPRFNAEANYGALKEFCKKYDLKFRYVPAEDYEYKKGHGFVKKTSLESAVTSVIFSGILLVIAFLLLNNITGFAISSEITKTKTNFSLGILFVLTIIGIFINSKKRKNIKTPYS